MLDALSWISLYPPARLRHARSSSPEPPSRSRRRSPSSICGEPASCGSPKDRARRSCNKGPYDDEPATIAQMEEFVAASRMVDDIANPASSEAMLDALDAHGGVPAVRLHHEIYLGDPRRTKPENLKTVIRHPVKPASA